MSVTPGDALEMTCWVLLVCFRVQRAVTVHSDTRVQAWKARMYLGGWSRCSGPREILPGHVMKSPATAHVLLDS